ncbi:MAG TPA: sn-glycerol-3-phosphate ABC transporter ATP-binding protein UgpC [Candidatus Izemoplasmatales bacterium]|nr:sn-glycerol-3-phosphate ABC transporter ATP-binding protein UgpC [Candidatus Izemoplasmatales bacterium]
MSFLTLVNVEKVFPNGVQAVYDFNLDVQAGEFIVLVGPSGCGKSTTLRMIAGLEEISKGTLSIDDKVINDMAPKDRDIAMVFQNYALYSHMTVYHNMGFSLVLRRENPDHIHERVMWAADILGLTPYLNRKPNKLSGGQRQRVALGRAIVRDPKIFLLDEPLSNLDAKLRSSMRKELKSLQNRLKATMVYVTHDQIEALTLADRIVIMKDGWIQQVGTPYEVYHDPQNVFVATFMGTPPMNAFPVKVTDAGDLSLDGRPMALNEGTRSALKEKELFGKEVILGIRPEHIAVERQNGQTDGFFSVADLYELLGSDALVHFNVEGKHLIAKIEDRSSVAAHDPIRYVFDPEHLYLFESDTGRRIHARH